MARVLICEAHDDISALLELVVRRLGHDPVSYTLGDAVAHVDAAVIEPGDPEALRLARVLRERDVPLLFTSIYPADEKVLELQPDAYLVKPFPLYALERALLTALAGLPSAAPAPITTAL